MTGERPSGDWLTTAEAAALLGVKPQTLYAYVSRGQLSRRRDSGGQGSRFHRREVERLAGRTSKRGRQGRVDVLIDTGITLLDPAGHLSYRGLDATALAGRHRFEQVAEWLWGGDAIDAEPPPWTPGPDLVAAAVSTGSVLPAATRPAVRLNVAVPLIGAADPQRGDISEAAVLATARRLLGALPESLPDLEPRAPGSAGDDGGYAARLWPRLCHHAEAVDPRVLALLDPALVLLADHELAASTLAVRVAASVRSDPYLVVAAGLSTLGGSQHGGASLLVEDLLRSLPDPETATAAVAARLDRGELVPGFGHAVYIDRDPRADRLLAGLRAAAPAHPTVAVLDAIERAVQSHGGPASNIDFALGGLAVAAGMVRGAGEAVFALARSAGWMAHAMEEYRRRSRFRMRAVYTGPAPAPMLS